MFHATGSSKRAPLHKSQYVDKPPEIAPGNASATDVLLVCVEHPEFEAYTLAQQQENGLLINKQVVTDSHEEWEALWNPWRLGDAPWLQLKWDQYSPLHWKTPLNAAGLDNRAIATLDKIWSKLDEASRAESNRLLWTAIQPKAVNSEGLKNPSMVLTRACTWANRFLASAPEEVEKLQLELWEAKGKKTGRSRAAIGTTASARHAAGKRC